MKSNTKKGTYIFGKHTVSEALTYKPNIIEEVFLGFEKDIEQRKLAKDAKVHISVFDKSKLPREVKNAVHQGVMARITPSKLLLNYGEFVEKLEVTNDTSIAVLGEIEDPQNVGSIIRSASAFGVSAVFIPSHNQSQITGSVIKVSAGGAFQIPLVSIGNVNTTLKDLKEKGFWIYGLDGEGETNLSNEDFSRPSVFVVGNEGSGIREKTKEECDIILKIGTHARSESLNAGVSAGIVFQKWSSLHPDALK